MDAKIVGSKFCNCWALIVEKSGTSSTPLLSITPWSLGSPVCPSPLPLGSLFLPPPLPVYPPVLPPCGTAVARPALRVFILGGIIYMKKNMITLGCASHDPDIYVWDKAAFKLKLFEMNNKVDGKNKDLLDDYLADYEGICHHKHVGFGYRMKFSQGYQKAKKISSSVFSLTMEAPSKGQGATRSVFLDSIHRARNARSYAKIELINKANQDNGPYEYMALCICKAVAYCRLYVKKGDISGTLSDSEDDVSDDDINDGRSESSDDVVANAYP
ncbi:hypothetical protein Tco_0952212 [Tanacetum coccineum]|uniref:Uncharacterized protein n=1 Tax=Tanacetum coccineum TaxID=301880 RepID=A0ABQ5DWF2_9ASTR